MRSLCITQAAAPRTYAAVASDLGISGEPLRTWENGTKQPTRR